VVAVAETPNIDGRLAERCWKEIPPLAEFVDLTSGVTAQPTTRVQLATAKRWLYVAAACETEDIRRAGAFRQCRDSDVFNDDSFEVLLDPLEPDGRVYRFVVNSIGTRRDEVIPSGGREFEIGRPVWFGRARRDVPPNQNRWLAELAIDLDSLQLGGASSDTWRANFIRHARGFSRSDSAWSLVRFWLFGCDRARLGTLVGMEKRSLAQTCRLRIAGSDVRPAGTLLRGRIAVEIANKAQERRTFAVALRTMTRWMNTQEVALSQGEHKVVEFTLEMSLYEEHEIHVAVMDRETKAPVASLAHVLTWPEPLKIRFDRSYYTNETTASLQAEIVPRKAEKQSLALRLFNSEAGQLVWQDTPWHGPPGRDSSSAPDVPFGPTASVPLSPLPVGCYLMDAVLEDEAAGQRYHAWRPMRRHGPRKGEVKVDGRGFFLRDGEPFFPIEVCRLDRPTRALFDEIKSKAAFNVNWAWYLHFRGTHVYVQNLYKGIGCLGDVNVDDLAYALETERDEYIARVEPLASLPMMFAYGIEGLPGEDIYSTAPIAAARSYLQSLDPHRPFYVVLTDPSQVERYRDCADFLVMRCRAIGPRNVGEPQWVWQQMCRACAKAGPGVPVVAMFSAYRDYDQGLERPTPRQMRVLTYMALIGGAAGISFDGYHYKTGADPAKRGFSDDPALRDMIYALSREVAFLGPILIAPERSAETITVEQPPGSPVRWTMRRRADVTYIVAANGAAENVQAVFRIGQKGKPFEVQEVFTNRAVALDESKLLVEFEPYGTRVFAIAAKRLK